MHKHTALADCPADRNQVCYAVDNREELLITARLPAGGCRNLGVHQLRRTEWDDLQFEVLLGRHVIALLRRETGRGSGQANPGHAAR